MSLLTELVGDRKWVNSCNSSDSICYVQLEKAGAIYYKLDKKPILMVPILMSMYCTLDTVLNPY